MKRQGQRGNFAMGLIVGLLVGLAVALIVALWVTKVPVPFVNKVPQRSAEQEAADAERAKTWDPNAGLAGQRPKTSPPPQPPGNATALPPYVPPVPPPSGSTTGTAAPAPARTAPQTSPGAPVATAPVTAPNDAGKPAAPKSDVKGDPFTYFVQAGAYTRPEDAETQRAKLAMMGFAAKVTEREQVGRTMYRVRIGPFEKKDAADSAQAKLQSAGVDAALVRVER